MTTNTDLISSSLDRRGFLRIGGLAAASAAALAACAGKNSGAGDEVIPQSGTAAPLATPPTVLISDGLLLRTAMSVHHNGIDLIDGLEKLGALGVAASAATSYRSVLKAQAAALSDAVTDLGGTPFEAANPVVNEKIILPALALVAASDSKQDDGARLVHAFVTLAATLHQAIVPLLSLPALRQTAMQIGVVHTIASTFLARAVSPDNITPGLALDASPETTVAMDPNAEPDVPVLEPISIYQVPTAFGSLSPVQVVLGHSTAEDATKRAQLGIDTPSFNSFIQDGQQP